MFKLNITNIFKRSGKDQSPAGESRSHRRFTIPGAQVGIQLVHKRGFRHQESRMEYFPLSDMSRGGLRFPSSTLFKPKAPLEIDIYLPDEEQPIRLRGSVRWFGVYPGISYTYHIGVQFAAFSEKPGSSDNDIKLFSRIAQLEKQYSTTIPEREAA